MFYWGPMAMRLILIFVFSLLFFPTSVLPQNENIITYQGSLEDGGQPATGEYDFEFSLYDAAGGGFLFAGPISIDDLFVDGGLFSARLDFGANVFGQNDLWLEIAIRDGASQDSFTVLEPRQPVTAAPLALVAKSVGPDSIGPAQIIDGTVGAQETNLSEIQSRIRGGCAQGFSIREINEDGSVLCEPDDDSGGDITSVQAGAGLSGGGSGGDVAISIDASQTQERVTGSCSAGSIITAINQDGSVSCGTLPVSGSFLTDPRSLVIESTVAFRDSGLPIIAYREDGPQDLMLYDCADRACSAGSPRLLDADGNAGSTRISILVRPSGKPLIAYWESLNRDLKVFDCDNSDCSSGTVRPLDTLGDVGRFPSIALGSDNLPIISYRDFDNGLKIFKCSNLSCSSGSDTLAQGTATGQGNYSSIAIQQNGFPIIALWDASVSGLSVYECTSLSCSEGVFRPLDTGNNSGQWASIVIRENGNPLIAHNTAGFGDLRVYDCSSPNCSSGAARALVEIGDIDYVDIALRDGAFPLISFNDADENRTATYECIDTGCSEGLIRWLSFDGWRTSIAIPPGGLPLISYQDQADLELKVFSCGSSTCAQ